MKNTKSKPPLPPWLILWTGVIAVSFSAIFVKMSATSSTILAAYRLLCVMILMTPFIGKYRHEFSGLTKRDWLYSTISGFFLAIHFIFWFESLRYTSIASSVVLVTLQPIFVLIGAFFLFKERTSALSLIGVGLAIVGSVIIGWGDFYVQGQALWGDVLALLGAVWISFYMLFGQQLRKHMNLFSYTYLVYGTSTVILLVYAFLSGESLGPYPLKEWWIFFLLAVVPTILGHTLFNWLLKWEKASLISMSILGEPVGASLLAYWIFGEKLVITQWIGGVLILFGIYWFVKTSDSRVEEVVQHQEM